jgi:hypothetical protein
MAISKTVNANLLSGVVGALSHWGPMRARTAILDTATEANNVFGRAFTFRDAAVETVQAGGAGAFAGIMVHPKAYRTGGFQPNGSVGEFLDMGEIFVEVAGAAASTIGAPVYFIPATGALTATATDNTLVPNAKFERHLPSAATPQLAVIRLTN